MDQEGKPLDRHRQVVKVPARWSGWLTVDLADMPPDGSVRLMFPREADKFKVAALTFGEDRLHWPWAQKARLTFQPRYDTTGPITVSFDPKHLLPEELRARPGHCPRRPGLVGAAGVGEVRDDFGGGG